MSRVGESGQALLQSVPRPPFWHRQTRHPTTQRRQAARGTVWVPYRLGADGGDFCRLALPDQPAVASWLRPASAAAIRSEAAAREVERGESAAADGNGGTQDHRGDAAPVAEDGGNRPSDRRYRA